MLERLQAAFSGRYRVEREIGAGGMATVFLATDLKHHRDVAIKVLRPELAAALGPERFLREVEIAARLQHPHILPVHDSGDSDGLLYYVMPFVAGESLRDRLTRGPLEPAEAARLAREIADALAYAHAQDIVHRDIKPANILLSQGHAMVADFGVARAVSASATAPGAGLTQAGMSVGTPTYMSPEQALGDPNVDGRTDVYALGVVLYEMLTGNPPFVGSTPQAIVGQILSHRVPPLPRDPLGLQPTLARALAREPGDRATARELSEELDGVATGTRRAGGPRRRRVGVAVAVAALAVVVATVVWPRGYRVAGDPRRSLIVFPFENRTGDASREYLGEAAMNLLGLAAAHWQDMRVFDDERTASLLRRRGGAGESLDFEDARAMAREARVGTLVLGDLRREGDSLAIEAKVHDVGSGDRLTTVIVRVPWSADPRPAFDQVAAEVLGTSGAPPGERPSVLAQTTTSIEAYQAYLAGTRALQRFEIDSARRQLERAVAIDTAFALAYIRLRDVDGWAGGGGNPERRRAYLLAAERHSGSLPPRLRALVQYHGAYMRNDFQRARAIAREMIARDSTDVEAWYQLGEAHYHHRAQDFPHPDTLGNLGLALRAFQRTLQLDSSYVLAYQHILDALGSCAVGFRVCTADSAIYGPPEELARRLGAATVERLRAAAQAARTATARGWIAAVPGTLRPHLALIDALYHDHRYAEAMQEAEAMLQAGWVAPASYYKASILFRQNRPREAAAAIDAGLAVVRDTLSILAPGIGDWSRPGALLAGAGGRWAAARRYHATMFAGVSADSVNGPGGLWMAKRDVESLVWYYVAAEVGMADRAPGERGDAGAEVRRVIERFARNDSTRRRRATQAWGASTLAIYLATRDTSLLTHLLRHVDTLGSSTWRVADAHLALARGDSARARMRVARHYRGADSVEFLGEQGMVRAFAWADLLARLGEPQEAIVAFTRLETNEQRIAHPGLLVRSWAERGALHQRLGQTTEALREYERFIDAWRDADPALLVAVERARSAVAALRGERAAPGDNP